MEINLENIQLLILDHIAWILFIIFFLMFIVLKPSLMMSFEMFRYIVYSSVPIGFLVLAESVALISGNFDLSIGQMAGLTAMATGVILANYSVPPFLFIVIPILIGTLCGSLNGTLVGFLGLNPFLSTLGTYMFFDGITLVIHSTAIWGNRLPSLYIKFGSIDWMAIAIFMVTVLILAFFLRKRRYGRNIYAVGADAETSSMLGIDVNKTTFLAFVIAGMCSGLAAVAYTGFNSAIPINITENTVFLAFAGAVIGGIELRGGRGSVMDSFAGALFLGIISAGLAMFNISGELREVFTGILVIGGIVIHRARRRMEEMILRPS